jgi:hypothetical protein
VTRAQAAIRGAARAARHRQERARKLRARQVRAGCIFVNGDRVEVDGARGRVVGRRGSYTVVEVYHRPDRFRVEVRH